MQVVARRSDANPDGDLTIAGDIDLSGYRYGPEANRADPSRRGFGESASLVLRAEGNINVYGSINDGLHRHRLRRMRGWQLYEGRNGSARAHPFGSGLVVPVDGVKLQPGTEFQAGTRLNYDVPVESVTLPVGTVLPAPMVISQNLRLPAGTVLGAAVTTDSGRRWPRAPCCRSRWCWRQVRGWEPASACAVRYRWRHRSGPPARCCRLRCAWHGKSRLLGAYIPSLTWWSCPATRR